MKNKRHIEPSYIHAQIPHLHSVRWYSLTGTLDDGLKLSIEYCVFWQNKRRRMIIREIAGAPVHISGDLQAKAKTSAILSTIVKFTAIETAKQWLEGSIKPIY